MPVTVTRKIEFDAAHRVLGHESKCKYLHGHRYTCEVTVQAPGLDALGRVVDFGVVKQLVGGWVDEHWDHNALLHPEDPLLLVSGKGLSPDLVGRDPHVMKYGNPTAENIARELYEEARRLLPAELAVVRVRVWETPNCHATYEPEA